MRVQPVRTRIFKEGEDLTAFITKQIPELHDGTVLAVTSKIVALAEGRTAIVKSRIEKEALIKRESTWAFKTHPEWWWTERDGELLVNAGIDDSNAGPSTALRVNKLVLLPKDSFKSAAKLRAELKRFYKIKSLGVVITDSRIAPLRAGVTALALGYAGFKGVRDYRGKKDLFGRALKVTQTNVADSLATAAALEMGEGAEQQPLAVIEDAPVVFFENVRRQEVQISPKEDMYRPLFKSVGKRTQGRRK